MSELFHVKRCSPFKITLIQVIDLPGKKKLKKGTLARENDEEDNAIKKRTFCQHFQP